MNKSSALKKLEEKRQKARPPLQVDAIVSDRPKPVSRPAQARPAGQEAQEEDREFMRSLLQTAPEEEQEEPTPPPQQKRAPKKRARKPKKPVETVVPQDAVSSQDTVNNELDNKTVVPQSTVNEKLAAETVVSQDTVSKKKEEPTVSPQNTVSSQTTVSPNTSASRTVVSQSTVSPPSSAWVQILADHPQVQLQVSPASNFTKLDNDVSDYLTPLQSIYEQVVYYRMYRLSWGYQRNACLIGYRHLAKDCGISKSSVRRAITGLIDKGHIQELETRNEKLKGTIYRVFLPYEILPALAGSKDGPLDSDPEQGDWPLKGPGDERVGESGGFEGAAQGIETADITGQTVLCGDTVSSPIDLQTVSPQSTVSTSKTVVPQSTVLSQKPQTVVCESTEKESTTKRKSTLEQTLELEPRVLEQLASPAQRLVLKNPKQPKENGTDQDYIYSRPSDEQQDILGYVQYTCKEWSFEGGYHFAEGTKGEENGSKWTLPCPRRGQKPTLFRNDN